MDKWPELLKWVASAWQPQHVRALCWERDRHSSNITRSAVQWAGDTCDVHILLYIAVPRSLKPGIVYRFLRPPFATALSIFTFSQGSLFELNDYLNRIWKPQWTKKFFIPCNNNLTIQPHKNCSSIVGNSIFHWFYYSIASTENAKQILRISAFDRAKYLPGLA